MFRAQTYDFIMSFDTIHKIVRNSNIFTFSLGNESHRVPPRVSTVCDTVPILTNKHVTICTRCTFASVYREVTEYLMYKKATYSVPNNINPTHNHPRCPTVSCLKSQPSQWLQSGPWTRNRQRSCNECRMHNLAWRCFDSS